MLKIAIAGKFRSGKTTLEDYIVNKYHYVPFAFGDELKNSFHEKYPSVPKNPKPRRGYQLHSDIMKYVYGEDIWIDTCIGNIRKHREVAESYNITGKEIGFTPLITDVRFPNEVTRCSDLGFVIIRVNCPDEIRLERANKAGDQFNLEDMNHNSESQVDSLNVDYDIDNSDTEYELYKQFEEIFSVEVVKRGL